MAGKDDREGVQFQDLTDSPGGGLEDHGQILIGHGFTEGKSGELVIDHQMVRFEIGTVDRKGDRSWLTVKISLEEIEDQGGDRVVMPIALTAEDDPLQPKG